MSEVTTVLYELSIKVFIIFWVFFAFWWIMTFYKAFKREQTQLKNKSMIGELGEYFKIKKKWWLLPLAILLCLINLFIIF